MKMRLNVQPFDFDKLHRKLDRIVQESVAGLGDEVERTVPVKTGKLKRSVRVEVNPGEDGADIEAKGAGVHRTVAPYIKAGDVVRMSWGGQRSPAWYGRIVEAKNPFVRPVLKRWKAIVRRAIRRAAAAE